MQIEIWGAYLHAFLKWQCRWRNVRIYKTNMFRQKKHTIQPAFGDFQNVGDHHSRTVSEASDLSGWALLFMSEHDVSPYWLLIPDRGSPIHTGPHSRSGHEGQVQNPHRRREIKARSPDVSVHNLVTTPTESLGLISLSANSKIYRNIFTLHYVFQFVKRCCTIAWAVCEYCTVKRMKTAKANSKARWQNLPSKTHKNTVKTVGLRTANRGWWMPNRERHSKPFIGNVR
jgi:hypothetical protein